MGREPRPWQARVRGQRLFLQGQDVLKRRLAMLLIAPILIISGGVPSLGVHSPAVIVLDPSPCGGQTVAPGATAIYTITITNNGPDAASSPIDIALADTDGVNFVSAVFDGGGSPITQVAIPPDDFATVELRVTASASAPYLASTTTTFTATRSDDPTVTSSIDCVTTVSEGPAVAMTKTADDVTPLVGQMLTYTIGWDNPGPQTVTGFVVTDTLDADLTFVDAGGGGTYDSGTRTITWTIGNLVAPAGGSVTFTATVDEVPDLTQISNTATGDGSDVASGQAQVTVTVQAPDLNLSKSVSDTTARPGDRLTYTIAYRNEGNDDLANTVLTDVIDPSLTVDTSTITAPGVLSGGQITWSLGTLAAGSATQTVSFEATVSVVPDGTSITDTATGDGDSMAPVTSNLVMTTINSEADLTISKVGGPDPVTAGEVVVYDITVSNLGPNDNSGFTVTDTLPAQVSSVVAPGCVIAGSVVTCSSSGILDGASQVFTITATVDPAVAQGTVVTNTASVSSTGTADPSASNDSTFETTTVIAETDLSVVKTASPDPVTAGELLTYSVTVTNLGPSDSSNFAMTDVLPTQTAFASASAGCSQLSGTVTCSPGGLAAGASTTFTITVTVNSSVTDGSVIDNTASVTSTTTDPVPGNDSDSASVDVNTSADLSIVKTDSPDPVIAGTQLTYSVTVTNSSGPSDNAGYTVTDNLPLGTTFNSASPGCSYSLVTDTVTCTSSGLAAGASQVFTVIVDVSAFLLPGVTLTNTADIATSVTPDPDPTNDSSTASTLVATAADLSITKSDSPDPALAGTNLTYTLTVTNAGPSVNAGFSVTDTLPSGVSFVSATSGCTESSGTVTCISGGLGVGATETYQIVVTVDPSYPGSGTILNTAAIATSTTTDPNSLNDSATESTSVDAEADLSVVKTDSPDPVVAGTNLTYTIVVSNSGPSDNVGYTVVDQLPPGTTFVSSSLACASFAGVVTCTSSGLAVATSVTYTVTVLVDGSVPDGAVITNTASIGTNATDDPDTTDDSDTTTTDVIAIAYLRVVKTDSPDPAEPTTDLTYSIVVTNDGPSDNTGFTIEDQIPSDTTFVTATVGDCSEASGLVTCSSAGLPAGSSVTWTVVVNVDAGWSDSDVISNTVSLLGTNTTDPDASNDFALATTTVSAPTMTLVKTANPASGADVSPGQLIDFTVTYENAGSASATDFVITDTVDPFLGGVTPDLGGTFDPVTRVVTWAIGTVAPGVTGTVSFSARVGSASSDRVINNTASALARQLSSVILSNQTSHDLRLPDVVITKTADRAEGSEVKASEVITYTLRVENRNTRGTAFDVVVTDALPPHVAYVPGSTTVSGSPVADVGGTSPLLGAGVDLGDMAPRAIRTITFKVSVAVSAPAGALLENWGYVDWPANAGPVVGDFFGLRVFRPIAGPSIRQSILVQGPSGSIIFVTVFNEVLGRSLGLLPVTGTEALLLVLLSLSGVGTGASLALKAQRKGRSKP